MRLQWPATTTLAGEPAPAETEDSGGSAWLPIAAGGAIALAAGGGGALAWPRRNR